MNQNHNPNERLLRVKEVAGHLGVGVSTVWLWNKQGKIPKPFKLTPSTTVWRHSEIQAYIQRMSEENLPKNEPVPKRELPNKPKTTADNTYRRRRRATRANTEVKGTGGE